MRRFYLAIVVAGIALSPGCAVTDRAPAVALDAKAGWVLLPIANHTDQPQASLRAEAILEGVLRSRGVGDLRIYPAEFGTETTLDGGPRKQLPEAVKWAKEQGFRYAVFGAVDEWRYKVGVDGEPAVGIALQAIDLERDAVVWSAVGAKSGWSREALSGVAQKLIRNLLDGARLK